MKNTILQLFQIGPKLIEGPAQTEVVPAPKLKTMKTLVPRSIKLGLILATFSMVAMAQSLNTFTCGPTTIAAGASFRCTVGITSAASIAGVTIKMSTIAGVNSPATVTIPWLQTTAIFTITTSASLTPQIAPMTATLGAISRSSPVTVASTVPYTI